MSTGFEVGKKYKSPTGHIYECVWAQENHGLMYLKGYVPCCIHLYDRSWVEYVEPRKEFFNAYKRNGSTYYVGPMDKLETADIIDRVESASSRYGILIVTHHSDTKVETEFHLTRKKK